MLNRFGSESLLVDQTSFASILANFNAIAETGSVDLDLNQAVKILPASNSFSARSTKIGSSAVLVVEGFIEPKETFWTRYGYGTALSTFVKDLKEARNDSDIENIYIYFDTPGGFATGNQEAADVIYETGSQKNTIGIGEGLVASAGYYLYSACKQTIATPSTKVGSIGSFLVHTSYQEYSESLGVKHTPIHFGANKVHGNMYKDLDEKGRAALQARVDADGQMFVNAVARHQGISADEVRKNYGDGLVFVASEALERGMIDSIGTFSLTTAKVDLSDGDESENTAIVPSVPRDEIKSIEVNIDQTTESTRSRSTTGETERRNESPTNRQTTESSGDSTNPKKVDEMKFSAKVKSAMFAFDMIKSADASDEVCEAALTSFCKAKSIAVPGENSTDAEIIALFTGSGSSESTNESSTETPSTPPAETVEVASESRAAALQGAVTSLANVGITITGAQLLEAQNSDQPVEKFIANWSGKGSDDQQNGTSQLPGQIRLAISSDDLFCAEATNRLLEIAGSESRVEGGNEVSTMRNWSGEDIFAECLSRMGTPHQRGNDWKQSFQNGLLNGFNPTSEVNLPDSNNSVSGYNNPSDLSFVVGRVINIVFDDGMKTKETTYERWTGMLPETNSLDPTQMVALSDATSLDQVIGTESAKEFAFEQEMLGHLFIDGFHNFVPITWEMSYGNNIGKFLEKIVGMSAAIRLTDQKLCLKALTSSENYSDTGNPLFHTSRGNYFTTGVDAAAPSEDQAEAHENAFMTRTGVGTNPETLNLKPSWALVPTGQKQAAKRTYYDAASFGELIAKATDATINTHRDNNFDVIVEPDLNSFSTTAWYTGTNPKRQPAIVRQNLAGIGRGGRRFNSFDADRRCLKVNLQYAVGTGVKNWRYINKDDGA